MFGGIPIQLAFMVSFIIGFAIMYFHFKSIDTFLSCKSNSNVLFSPNTNQNISKMILEMFRSRFKLKKKFIKI